MHVSTASVVKFVGMVFPCLCETPVTSCAKQGTKKKTRETHRNYYVILRNWRLCQERLTNYYAMHILSCSNSRPVSSDFERPWGWRPKKSAANTSNTMQVGLRPTCSSDRLPLCRKDYQTWKISANICKYRLPCYPLSASATAWSIASGHMPLIFGCKFINFRITFRITSDDFRYPLVNEHNFGKSQILMGKLTISMAMFNSYFDITRSGIFRSP